MDHDAAKLIGAGLAAIGVLGGGIGVGQVWAQYMNAVARNPSMEDRLRTPAFLGFALSDQPLPKARQQAVLDELVRIATS